jgi:antitoxin PrlF
VDPITNVRPVQPGVVAFRAASSAVTFTGAVQAPNASNKQAAIILVMIPLSRHQSPDPTAESVRKRFRPVPSGFKLAIGRLIAVRTVLTWHRKRQGDHREIISKLTSKAQTTIPQSVRSALGIAAGDEIAYRIENGRGILTKAPDRVIQGSDPW